VALPMPLHPPGQQLRSKREPLRFLRIVDGRVHADGANLTLIDVPRSVKICSPGAHEWTVQGPNLCDSSSISIKYFLTSVQELVKV